MLLPFLIAFLISMMFPFLAGYSLFYSLLVTEITPYDQIDIPVPKIGDRVMVYGVWVQDTEFTDIGLGGWHEIHPVRYIEIDGNSYGTMPYKDGEELFTGVWSPQRLIVLDKVDPYRIARGTVAEVFTNIDGDYHVHLMLDEENVGLLRQNVFATSLPVYQILKVLSPTPVVVMVAYVITSAVRPDWTSLGRKVFRRK